MLQHRPRTGSGAGQTARFIEFRSKLALDGHDPVAYFKAGKPVKGLAGHALIWNGATWHFASADNKAAVRGEPAGLCARNTAAIAPGRCREGYTAKGDPDAWRIVDSRLYLNYNASVQKSWEKDIPGHIAKGDGNWPKVLSK